MKKTAALFLFGLLPAIASAAEAKLAGLEQIEIQTRVIENFKIGSQEQKFGRLEFVGGLEMTSASDDLGALSAFRFLDAGAQFIGVADTGFWFSGSVARDANGRPSGVSGFQMRAMPDASGKENRRKWETDAEGILVEGGKVTVSFERVHRIASGRLDVQSLDIELKKEKLPIPASELRSNRGFETIALSPPDSGLQGARVAVTEKSLNKAGDIYAAVLEGSKAGIFYVSRNGEYDITDGDFLPNGDLLLLERRFNMAVGIAMRLRLIKGNEIEKGATVNGETLLEADLAYQIDNMEALDVWQDGAGVTRVTLMSDDNHSILQRNMLLEFKLTQ